MLKDMNEIQSLSIRAVKFKMSNIILLDLTVWAPIYFFKWFKIKHATQISDVICCNLCKESIGLHLNKRKNTVKT